MLNYVKKLAASVLLAGSVLFIAISAPNIHNHYLRYNVGSSVVQVLSPAGGGGTGFAIQAASGTNYIATNRHVCESAINGWMVIKQDEGKPMFKRVVYKDSRHDLCLVEGDKRFKPLKLANFEPEKGDFHYVIGHPGLRQLTVSQGEHIGYFNVEMLDLSAREKKQCLGKIIDLNILQQMFMGREWVCVRNFRSYSTTAVVYGGNSGSPVVNKYGSVIGVVFAGDPQQERNNFVVPLHELKRVLAKF